jgi:pimeloyl-ACP methyl ester carboxylesterase
MRLAAREAGDGADAVVLLHGLFGQGRNLTALQASLAATHRVIALDLRNHGASPHAAGMAYGELAGDVIETLDALDVPRCAVLGHSMGGKVAMRLALEAPGRVSRLVVADIAPVAYAGEFGRFAAAMQAVALVPGLTRAAADAALAEAVPDAGVRAFLLSNLSVGAAPAWRIGLAEIAAGLPDILGWPATTTRYEGPALFVGGARSGYITADRHAGILALFPAAQFATVADAGHWLHVDNPAGFLDAVQPFLALP